MHLIAAVANGWRVEFHVPMWVTGEMIYRDPPKPSRGTVTLTEQPGLGLTPNEEALKDSRSRNGHVSGGPKCSVLAASIKIHPE